MIFTEQELDAIIWFLSDYVSFSEKTIKEGLEQEDQIESILTLIESWDENNHQELRELMNEASQSFKDKIDKFLDHRLIFTNIIEKCKDMKSNMQQDKPS